MLAELNEIWILYSDDTIVWIVTLLLNLIDFKTAGSVWVRPAFEMGIF